MRFSAALAAFAFCANCATAAADGLAKCQPGMVLPVWQPQDDLTAWDRILRGLLYFALLSYFFLGVSIGSDRFMGAIEVITSQERELLIRKKGSAQGQRVKVRVWNETIANLTLMALGSSAPEILLSIIEIVGKNFAAGDLGPGTIVGSAAYNLFVIMAICVHVIPDGEVRRIRHLSVFFVTATWSVFAYIWMYLILAVISEGVVECWEALLTFLFFPATVLTAYAADRKLRIFGFKRFRLRKKNRIIVAAEGGDCAERPDDEQQLEDEILEESSVTDPHHFAIILRDLKKRNSSATPDQLERMAVDELAKRTHKSKAFYRLQANKQLTGGVAQMHHRRSEQPHAEMTTCASVQQPSCRISLQPDHYTVLENVGQFEVYVVREGDDLQHTISVFYTTEDGTAVAGSDYEGATGTVVFEPGEQRKSITLRVIDDDIFEEDEHFYLHLTKAVLLLPNGGGAAARSTAEFMVALGPPATATIVILDDDHCGVFGFASDQVEVAENVGLLRLEVVRSSGARGAVRLDYAMTEGTAKHERHFVQKSGTLVFENNEARKEIEIEIVEENCYEKNVSFFVELKSPKEESNEQILTNRSEPDIGDVSDEDKIAMSGKPRLGPITKVQVVIRESDEFKNTVNKLVEQEGPSVGFSSWPQQFINAFRVKVDDDESEENKEVTTCDYITHFLTFFWKIIFAFVPPADMCSGYLCFTVSIIFIGVLTAVIGDLASHFGCSVGLKDSVTAVTFVALGTSVPDTFASKVAAIQDSTADNSVGNVTGSNAVNVFLGIGIAWSIAAFYHKWYRKTDFEVNAGNLAFCVTLFCTEAAVAIALLLLRRSKVVGGELGGPVVLKRLTSAIFFLLWIIYISMAALEAYGVIEDHIKPLEDYKQKPTSIH